jgi:hypothetical protein
MHETQIDTIETNGYRFGVYTAPDQDHGAPWEEFDGHGVISEWTRRSKQPGERVLCEDRGSFRYYDLRASMALARRDNWGCGDASHAHRTDGERAACAVEQDYRYLRGWCRDDWDYVGVIVRLLDDDREESESVWGIESNSGDYLREVAGELVGEILGRIEVDQPRVILSEN